MAFKVLATADLHLGRKSSRLPADKRAEYGPTTHILKAIQKAAITHQVDAVVMAGDVIDASNHFIEVYNDLYQTLRKLIEQDIDVVLTAGNHDYEALAEFVNHLDDRFPKERLHFLGQHGQWSSCELQNNSGESLQCIGWSFDSLHFQDDPTRLLNTELIHPSMPTLGVLHGDFSDEQSRYAPMRVEHLTRHDVAGWIVGHIHKPEVLNITPLVAYPGSPQPLSPKETGEHGVMLLQIEPDGTIQRERLEIAPLRYETATLEITPEMELPQLRSHCLNYLSELTFDADLTLLDLELTGRSPHLDALEELSRDLEGHVAQYGLVVSEVTMNVRPAVQDLDTLARFDDPLGMVAQALIDLKQDQPNEFLDAYRAKVESRRLEIDSSKTFSPLEQVVLEETLEQADSDSAEQELNQVIADQLWSVLYELNQQKGEAAHG
jgi:DNA repair exonuclease SbcCD nuclease subunit